MVMNESPPNFKFAAHADPSNLQGLHQGQVSHFIWVELCKLHPGMPRKKGWFSAVNKKQYTKYTIDIENTDLHFPKLV